MPATAARTLRLTPEEYAEWEAGQVERYEYHFGEVFPMPGGTSAHATLINRIGALLYLALRETDCEVRSEAMRVQMNPDQFVYADATATCGEAEFGDERQTRLLNPTLVVEVLSKNTRAYDVGEKLDLYRSMPSVQEVLFVDSEVRAAWVVRRRPGGWMLTEPVAGGRLRLESVDAEVDLDEAYRGVVPGGDAA